MFKILIWCVLLMIGDRRCIDIVETIPIDYLVCLVWSLNEFFQVSVDLSHWILGLREFSSIYTSLTLEATSSHP